MKNIIETLHLDFSFRREQKILQALNLQVPARSIYGFLGPNGAGKTTTLRLILGLLKKQQGTIKVFGEDFQTHRLQILQRLGTLIEQPSLYLHLTGYENLRIFQLNYGCNKKRIGEVLELVRLKDAASKKVKTYSLGMKQRLAIAIALLHDPECLILDEPMNGLDPNGIIETRELIRHLNRSMGKTILISSHLLSEMEKVATHIGIIHKGKLLFQGALTELQQLKSRQSSIEIEVSDTGKAHQLLKEKFTVREVNGSRLEVGFETRERSAQLNKLLVQGGVDVYRLSVTQNDLENLFMQITSE